VQISSDRDDGVKNILQRNVPNALPSNECLTAQASQFLRRFFLHVSEKKNYLVADDSGDHANE
jgi:hypothetical protein